MLKSIVRYAVAQERLGDVSRDTLLEKYILKDPADPFVPGTRIPRLKPVHLGPKTPGLFSEELDGLIVALVALRDVSPLAPSQPGGCVPAEFHSSIHRNPKRADNKRAKSRMPSPSRRAAKTSQKEAGNAA
jgi:hypothetical protein